MLTGTKVAIHLGDAMVRECERIHAPGSVVADLKEQVDDLIVFVLRHGSSTAEVEQYDVLCKSVADAFALAIGCAWETTGRREGWIGASEK